mmetsp:Transcript_90649/g.240799  ORF Transcript_90649/g.240799 Transcript_90649/m.240799 type:complete len:492 (-) Transcript_90649:470-1945(-)
MHGAYEKLVAAAGAASRALLAHGRDVITFDADATALLQRRLVPVDLSCPAKEGNIHRPAGIVEAHAETAVAIGPTLDNRALERRVAPQAVKLCNGHRVTRRARLHKAALRAGGRQRRHAGQRLEDLVGGLRSDCLHNLCGIGAADAHQGAAHLLRQASSAWNQRRWRQCPQAASPGVCCGAAQRRRRVVAARLRAIAALDCGSWRRRPPDLLLVAGGAGGRGRRGRGGRPLQAGRVRGAAGSAARGAGRGTRGYWKLLLRPCAPQALLGMPGPRHMAAPQLEGQLGCLCGPRVGLQHVPEQLPLYEVTLDAGLRGAARPHRAVEALCPATGDRLGLLIRLPRLLEAEPRRPDLPLAGHRQLGAGVQQPTPLLAVSGAVDNQMHRVARGVVVRRPKGNVLNVDLLGGGEHDHGLPVDAEVGVKELADGQQQLLRTLAQRALAVGALDSEAGHAQDLLPAPQGHLRKLHARGRRRARCQHRDPQVPHADDRAR